MLSIRKLANEAEAVTMLQQALEEATPGYSWSIVVVMHETKRSPCVLAHMLSDCDVLLTPHGFQSMLVRLFLALLVWSFIVECLLF